MVHRKFISFLGSIVAVGLVIFHAMIAHGKISVALRQRELGDEGGGGLTEGFEPVDGGYVFSFVSFDAFDCNLAAFETQRR